MSRKFPLLKDIFDSKSHDVLLESRDHITPTVTVCVIAVMTSGHQDQSLRKGDLTTETDHDANAYNPQRVPGED